MHNVRNVIMSKFSFLKYFNRYNVGLSAVPNLVLGSDIPRSRTPFANTMQYVKRKSSRYNRRRKYSVPRGVRSSVTTRSTHFARSSNPQVFPLVAGNFSRATDLALNLVQTTDIGGTWDMYRIKKIMVTVAPQVDPGNSGVVNNASLQWYFACDHIGAINSANFLNVGAFQNHKMIVTASGASASYMFYPKVTNTVDVSGTASAVGAYGASNPWINCTTAGFAVPHKRLLLCCTSNDTTSVQKLVLTYKIFFECKNIY